MPPGGALVASPAGYEGSGTQPSGSDFYVHRLFSVPVLRSRSTGSAGRRLASDDARLLFGRPVHADGQRREAC